MMLKTMYNLRRQLLLVLALILQVWCQDRDECPPGWISYEFSCYKFVRSTPKKQNDARAACMNYNARLASINTMEEHSFITEWLRQNDPQHKTWYTSGYDTGVNVWQWEGDNSLISNLDQAFLPNQELEMEKKFVAYNYSEYARRWGFLKVSGFEDFPYICEIPKDMLHLIVIHERGFDYGLIVKDKSKLHRGPKITTEPIAVIFDTSGRGESNEVTLRCVADGYPPPEYEWYKEEYENNQLKLVRIDPMNDERITLTDGALTIYGPKQIQDRGKYHCRARNKYGTVVSQSVQLGFGYINQFNLKRSNEQGKENWGKAIYCDPPQHFPALHYYWARDTYPNFVDEDKRTFVSQDGNLYFSALENIDNGLYLCFVQSVVSSTGRLGPDFNLEVISQPSSQQLTFPNNFPKVFPEAPIAGQDVRIECVVFGYPVPSYNWTRRGSNDLPPQAIVANYGRVLLLPRVTVEDEGEYMCTASNSRMIKEGVVTLSVQAKPIFTLPLDDVHMDLDSYLYWMCEAFGIPEVEYEWLKNGEPLNEYTIAPADREFITVRRNILTIQHLNPDRDSGVYQCKATNQLGTTYSTGQLRVLSLRPSFTKFPLEAETYAVEKSNVTIPCRPEAAPMPRFTWYKNRQVLSPTSRIFVLPNGYLLIQSVMREDEGNYMCQAENAYGSDASEGRLRVLRYPTIYQQPANKVVNVNGSLNLICEASSDEGLDLTYTWYLNGLRIDALDEQKFSLGWHTGVLFGRNITFAESGVYKCVAKTPISGISAQAKVFVQGPPGAPGGLQVIDSRDKNIILTWSDGASNGQPIVGYRIEGRTNWNPSWLQIMDGVKARIDNYGRKSALIRGALLSPWCNYEFRVISYNSEGYGLPSDSSPIHRTDEAAPAAFPLNIGGGGGKVGDLTITWSPLPPQEQNAPGVFYGVYFKPAESLRDYRFEDLKHRGNVGMHVVRIGSNEFYKPYKVMVQAFNTKGAGPKSQEVEVYSAEDLPQAVPVEVQALPHNSTALNITWKPLDMARDSIRGKLIGYRIKYWNSAHSPDTALYYLSRYVRDWALIVGLQPYTYYAIAVSAFNGAGAGPESEFFTQRTFKAAPLKPPTSVEVIPISPTTIKVTWRFTAPSNLEEPLLGFKVRYWEADRDFSTYMDVFVARGGAALEATVSGLVPGNIYKLRVLAYSNGGDGRMSSPTWEFKMGGVAPGHEGYSPYRFLNVSSQLQSCLVIVIISLISAFLVCLV